MSHHHTYYVTSSYILCHIIIHTMCYHPFVTTYVYIRVCVCVCVCVYTYTHACMHTYIYMHACMHAYIHIYIHIYTHTHIHTYIHTYIHAYIHVYKRTYTHTNMHTYMYINGKRIYWNGTRGAGVNPLHVYIYHRRRSEVIRLFLSGVWAHIKKISYYIKPGIAGNIIDIGQIPGFVS